MELWGKMVRVTWKSYPLYVWGSVEAKSMLQSVEPSTGGNMVELETGKSGGTGDVEKWWKKILHVYACWYPINSPLFCLLHILLHNVICVNCSNLCVFSIILNIDSV